MLSKIKELPRPYPYAEHTLNRFGAYSFIRFKEESQHISIGEPEWMPAAYICALRQLEYGASGTLCRYMAAVDAFDGVAALENWNTRDDVTKQAWLDRFEEDFGLLKRLDLDYDTGAGSQAALANLLFTLAPPHKPIVLCCPQEYADWHKLPENLDYQKLVLTRYDWLQAQVIAEFAKDGFEVRDSLVKVEQFKGLYHDEWDIYNF